MEEPFLEYPRVETLEQLCIEFSEPRRLPGGDPILENAPAAFFHHCSEAKDNCTGDGESEVAGCNAQHKPDDPETKSQERWRGAPVARRRADELSYDEFLRSFMAANVPVVIEGTAASWPVMRDLVRPDGGIDLSRLTSDFGGAEVPVTTMPDHPDGDWLCQNMRVEEFARWWRERHGAGIEPSGPVLGDSCAQSSSMQGAGLKYLKDWHFVNEFGDSYTAYQLPKYFREDWLNEYFDSQHLGKERTSGGDKSSDTAASDYRFVYCGPKGTWTPIHADVLRSFSWSGNVAGRKRWLLLPPEHTHLLYDRFRHRMATTFRAEELNSLLSPENSFPLLESAAEYVTEVIQCPGEAIFVPSGWHHMVENLDDCLSINHNWFNAWNIHWIVAFVLSGHREATDAIEDCRDICSCADEFEDLVQRNLAANCGLDFHGLVKLLSTIAHRLLHADASGTSRHQEGGDSDSALLLSSKIEQMQACHALEALLEHWPSSPRATINDEGVAGVGCNNNLSSQDSVPYSTFLLPETHRLAAATLKFLKK